MAITSLRKDSLSFELVPKKSYTTKCSECADNRSKQGTRSLSVYRDEDGMIRYKCHHPGCALNKWSQTPDPSPEDVDRTIEAVVSMPVPTGIPIPEDYNGDKLFWYRDIDGNYLFANRRINLNGTKLYVPFIWTDQGFTSGKGAKWPDNFTGLYGAETIRGKSKVVIVEGEKAADAAMKIFPEAAVVSWLGGANRGYDKANWSLLAGFETALLWPDNDEAGIKVMASIAKLIPANRVLIADVTSLPLKSDLADELTKEDIKKAVVNAKEVSTKMHGVFSLSDIKKQIEQVGEPRKSGYEVFDFHTKLPRSGLLVVEGRTKHGKSALAVALTSSMLRKDTEKQVTFYSYEMTAAKVFGRYLKSVNPNIELKNYEQFEESKQVCDLVESGRLQIIDQSSQLSMAEIIVSLAKPRMKGSVVVIDYLQIVPVSSAGYKSSRQLMLKEMLDELRVVAHSNNILVIVLSQLTPDYADPRNDSPREAKDIHYSADLVLRIWNKSLGELHPKYQDLPGNYLVHVYLNRDGTSNILFEGNLEGGSKLTLKRRLDPK